MSVVNPITGAEESFIEFVLAGESIRTNNGLAVSPVTREMYAAVQLDRLAGKGRNLIKINRETGVATNIGNMGQPIASLAFDGNGVLYAVSGDCLNNCGGSGISETLFTVNTNNASLTMFRALGHGNNGEAIAFNPNDGMMYHLSGKGAGLIFEKINLSNGVITSIPLSGSPVANLEAVGFTFDSGQNLFIGGLIDFDLQEGNFVKLSSGGFLTLISPIEFPWKDYAFYDSTSGSDGDVTGVVDISGDAVPDIAHLTNPGQPKVSYYSGASRQKIKGASYLGQDWSGVAAATVVDSNGDGVANDPAVAVLAHKASAGKHAVEVRRADNGALIKKIFFLSAAWEIIDVAVLDDKNGDGVTGDTAIAVLAYNPNKAFDAQIKVQVRRLRDGKLLADWFFLNGNWTPLALEAVHRVDAAPLLAVLANKAATGANIVQARRFSTGTVQRNTSFFNANWVARDVAILLDSDGDGNANDPAYLVLANHQETGRNKVQVRRVSDGTRLQNVTMLGTNWDSQRVTGTGDISGNLREEVGVLAAKKTDGTIAIQLKDYEDRTTTATIFP